MSANLRALCQQAKTFFFSPCAFNVCLCDLREDSRIQREIAEGKEKHLGMKLVLMVIV